MTNASTITSTEPMIMPAAKSPVPLWEIRFKGGGPKPMTSISADRETGGAALLL